MPYYPNVQTPFVNPDELSLFNQWKMQQQMGFNQYSQQQQNQSTGSQPPSDHQSDHQSFNLIDETEDENEEEPIPTPTSKKSNRGAHSAKIVGKCITTLNLKKGGMLRCDFLEAKYMAEDASSKKFLVSNFTNYKMTDSRPVMKQYNELFGTLDRLTQHKMNMDEAIRVSCIIDKLPLSWKDFRHTLKHKKDELTRVELGSNLRIEESLRAHDSDKPKGNNVVVPQ
ncbi:hypothetical protein Tco_0285630 [Tanacetum coccineum]